MKKLKYVIATTILSIISGCVNLHYASQNVIPRETVLSDGMKICASYENEHICIAAEGFTKRIISWDGKVHAINLVPRIERWYGKLGLVSPKQPKNLWRDHGEITRALIKEAEIKYNSVESSLKRLESYKTYGHNVVYNDNGILFIWSKAELPGQNVLSLSVFQIIINGKKPKFLPGSNNDKVVITYKKADSRQ